MPLDPVQHAILEVLFMVMTYLACPCTDALQLIHIWLEIELENLTQSTSRVWCDIKPNNIRHGLPVSRTNSWVAHNTNDRNVLLTNINNNNSTVTLRMITNYLNMMYGLSTELKKMFHHEKHQ